MNRLNQEINGISIAIFRIGFGLFMIWEILYLMRIDFVNVFLINPKVQLYYEFIPFLKPLPKAMMDVLIVGLLIASILITIGKYYRKAMIFFCIGFTYIFLLDKAYYNNHLYLVCLLSFLFIFIPADHKLSLTKKESGQVNPVRHWHLLILKIQLVLVYFFGGIAKLNSDWLVSKQPTLTILSNKAQDSIFGSFLTSDFMTYFVTYGGLVFDLCIGFFLFIPRFRIIAIIAALFFNITNAWLFDDINIFPYMMIIALVLFLDPHKIASYVNKKLFDKRTYIPKKTDTLFPIKKPILIGLSIYIFIQFVLPLRHVLFPGNTEWTGHGQRFAWRMKIQYRQVDTLEFKVWDIKKKIIYPIDYRSYGMNQDQINALGYYPKTAVQFAKFLKNHSLTNKGMDTVQVRSRLKVSLNGRPAQYIFDKDVDVASLKIAPFDTENWVTTLNDIEK